MNTWMIEKMALNEEEGKGDGTRGKRGVKYWGCSELNPSMCNPSSVIGVRCYCQGLEGLGKMGVMCKVGAVDYSVTDECGGGRGIEGR
jgi:hypothetical protein